MNTHPVSEGEHFAQTDLGTSVLVPETSPSIYDLLAGIGNHEAKALVLLYLGNTGIVQTRPDMSHGFKEFIGHGALWYPSNGVTYKYCQDSLYPIGQVVEGKVQTSRGPSDGFGISRFGREIGIPVAGHILQWSLEHPEISVQSILGRTHTRGATRAPQNRIAILNEIGTHPSEWLSNAEIANLKPDDWNSKVYKDTIRLTDSSTRSLVSSGVLLERREADTNNRRFRINAVDHVDTSDTTQGRYKSRIISFMQSCVDNGQYEFTTEECFRSIVDDVKVIYPQVDESEVRHIVTNLLASKESDKLGSTYRHFPNLERLEMFFDGNKHTKFGINPHHSSAVERLIDFVMLLDDCDSAALEEGRQMAAKISSDSDAKIALIEKAHAFSSAANKKPLTETMRDVEHILGTLNGPVDAATVFNAYISDNPRPLSKESIANALRKLETSGKVGSILQRPKLSSRIQRRHYFLVPEKD